MERLTDMQLFGSGNVDCGNVTNSYNNTITVHNGAITVNKADGEDNQVKQWLSPLEPRHRHQSVQANRVNGVGGWLLERNEFREWSGVVVRGYQSKLYYSATAIRVQGRLILGQREGSLQQLDIADAQKY